MIRDQALEAPGAARAVPIHDDDLGGSGTLAATHRRVDLSGIEPPPLFIERRAAVDLLPHRYTGHAFHVAPQHDAHRSVLSLSAKFVAVRRELSSPQYSARRPRFLRRN